MDGTAGGRPLRLLFLNWRDTGHHEGGGSEVYAERVADGLAARGYEVTFLTARYRGAPDEERRPSGVRVVRRGHRLSVYAAAALAYLRRDVARPDLIVETQNGMPYLAALWAGRTTHVVLVHHVHREQWPVVFGPVVAGIGWWIESWLAPRVNRRRPYVAVSDVTREELVELGVDRERISIIHNGALPPPPQDTERSPTPQLLVMGRLVPHKRVEIALHTIERLRAELTGARLVIAGRGWWEDRIVEEIDHRGLWDAVDLRGYVSDEERHRLYASSWVSLVPSVKEGWGLVVVEAGMHGTPSVAFDGTGGVTESIVDGETGLLARHDDVDDFVALTRRLVLHADERERMGAAAQRFASRFTWDEAVSAYERLLTDTVSRRHETRRLARRP